MTFPEDRAETAPKIRTDGSRMPPPDPEEIGRLSRLVETLTARSRRLTWGRLVSFLVGATGVVLGLGSGSGSELGSGWGWGWGSSSGIAATALVCLGAGGFALAFAAHVRTLGSLEATERRKTLLAERCERGGDRRRRREAPALGHGSALAEGRILHANEPESRALEAAVLEDLQVLSGSRDPQAGAEGGHSLFALLDWTSTILGARRLRRMITHPLVRRQDIVERQEAVGELAGRPESLERILEALEPMRRADFSHVGASFETRSAWTGRWILRLWCHALGTAIPLCAIVMAVQGSLDLAGLLFGLLAASFATIGLEVKRSNPERDRLLLLVPLIDGLLRLRTALETTGTTGAWSSGPCRSILETIDSVRPALLALRRRLSLLALHEFGVFFEILNLLTLWELRVLPGAAAIVDRHGRALEGAAGALAETEALASFALPLAEAEDFSLPRSIESPEPRLEAETLAHPLIDPKKVVRNPVRLGGSARVLILTGSNMSGKSTYLKSVGVNLLLAQCGAPVCARDFRWTPLDLHTDINVRDSLDDAKSYFQVEVDRVHGVLRAAKESAFVLAIFDEIFRGTNSAERIALVRAILRHLRDLGALCIVATHDMALTELVAVDGEPSMENRHFQETIVTGDMRFDYQLRDGPATTRNAILLLESCGYPREITEEARRAVEAAGGPGPASGGRAP